MDTAVAIDGCHFTTRHALLCLLPPRCLRSVCRSLSSNPVFPGFPLFVLLAATISAAWPLAIGHCLPDNYPRSSNLGGPRLLSGLHAQQPEPRHRSHGFCLVQPGRRRCSEVPSAMGAVLRGYPPSAAAYLQLPSRLANGPLSATAVLEFTLSQRPTCRATDIAIRRSPRSGHAATSPEQGSAAMTSDPHCRRQHQPRSALAACVSSHCWPDMTSWPTCNLRRSGRLSGSAMIGSIAAPEEPTFKN